jgi:hypothetical protein
VRNGEASLQIVNDAVDNGFTELVPLEALPNECTEFLFDRAVDCLVHIPSVVEVAIQLSILRIVEGCELAVLHKWSNIVVTGKSPSFWLSYPLSPVKSVIDVAFRFTTCGAICVSCFRVVVT